MYIQEHLADRMYGSWYGWRNRWNPFNSPAISTCPGLSGSSHLRIKHVHIHHNPSTRVEGVRQHVAVVATDVVFGDWEHGHCWGQNERLLSRSVTWSIANFGFKLLSHEQSRTRNNDQLTRGNGLLLGGKPQPKLEQNMLNIVYRSNPLRRIMNQFIYSDVCTEVLGLGCKISSFYLSSHPKEIIISRMLSNDNDQIERT